MPDYTLAPPPYHTVLDTAGAPVPNACVWTYVAGTTTPIATYSDALGTPNTNPIRTDSAGRFTAYLAPGTGYKFVYELPCTPPSGHGALLRTADNISGTPAAAANVDLTVTGSQTIPQGQVAYLAADGFVYLATTNSAAQSSGAIYGVAATPILAGQTGTLRLAGRVTANYTGLAAGALYYISNIPGGFTPVVPTVNAAVVGFADTPTSIVVGRANLPLVNTANLWTGRQDFTTTTEQLTSVAAVGGVLTLNMIQGTQFTAQLTAATTVAVTNIPTAPSLRIFVLTLWLSGDGTARAITWPAGTHWPNNTPPVFAGAAGKIDIFRLTTYDNGTNWYGSTVGQLY